jgi:tripartite-type tricarboxylate transporter receptor subunit TctC
VRVKSVVLRGVAIGLCVVAPGITFAQDLAYPAKTVRLVTTRPGSGSDVVARILLPSLTKNLGQTIVIDNRGNIAAQVVAKSDPDGYTLLGYGPTVWISPLINSKTGYDAQRDFIPITMAAFSPNVIVVHPSLPVKSVKDLVTLAKARPGQLNYASGSTGSGSHLTGELLRSLAGVKIVRIGYKGSGPGLLALISGEVEMSFPNAGTVAPHLISGKLRALAVTTLRRSKLTPGLPTVAESGVTGFESSTPFGYFAPTGTPPAIITRLHKALLTALKTPGVNERLFGIGMEVVADTPQQFAAMVKADIAKWRKLIKDVGIIVN